MEKQYQYQNMYTYYNMLQKRAPQVEHSLNFEAESCQYFNVFQHFIRKKKKFAQRALNFLKTEYLTMKNLHWYWNIHMMLPAVWQSKLMDVTHKSVSEQNSPEMS